MAEITLTKDNFEQEVLKASLPVVVDFWATWCGPCQMPGPVLEDVANENEGKLIVGKVNVDDQAEIAMQYKISECSIRSLRSRHFLFSKTAKSRSRRWDSSRKINSWSSSITEIIKGVIRYV